MRRQILVGLAAGVVLLVLDGLLSANPFAQRVYAVYRPIARPSVNAVAGSLVDLAYGLILVALFVTLRHCLPGRIYLTKGLSFGVIVWFLRVVMRVAGEWVVTTVPASAHAYTLRFWRQSRSFSREIQSLRPTAATSRVRPCRH